MKQTYFLSFSLSLSLSPLQNNIEIVDVIFYFISKLDFSGICPVQQLYIHWWNVLYDSFKMWVEISFYNRVLCITHLTREPTFFQGLKMVLSSVAVEEEAMETDNQQDPNGDK